MVSHEDYESKPGKDEIIMKTKQSGILLAMTLLVLALAGTSMALPPGKGTTYKKLATEADFAALKSGDRIALVCKQCETVSTAEVTDPEQAMEICKEGAVIHCPECKLDYKVTRRVNPAGKVIGAGLKKEVVIVNANGEPCMFYTKIQ